MVHTTCAVRDCRSSSRINKDLHFHQFPRTEERCALWVQACKRSDLAERKSEDLKNTYICSLHFESSMYGKKALKKTAIPTLLLPTKAESFSVHTQTDSKDKIVNKVVFYRPDRCQILSQVTLRWGILTAGNISNDFVNAFNSYPDIGNQVIVGIAARDKTKAEEFAKLHGIQKVFDDYQELAENKDIDVVYIGALAPYHYPLTKLCLDYGKHVLCEKPFTLNSKQTQSIITLAKKKNLFVMEAIWSRFSPSYIDLEKEINAGNLGEIRFVEGNFGISCDSERLFKKELGGSAVLDIGIYLLQLSQYVFKEEPIKVNAVGVLNEFGVDASETIILEYSRGRRAVLNTQTKLKLCNNATVYGTKGQFTLQDPFHFPVKVTLPDGNTREYPLHTSNKPYMFENSAGLVYQALEVARCIREGLMESPRMSHKESLMLARLMDTVRDQLGVRYDVDDATYP